MYAGGFEVQGYSGISASLAAPPPVVLHTCKSHHDDVMLHYNRLEQVKFIDEEELHVGSAMLSSNPKPQGDQESKVRC